MDACFFVIAFLVSLSTSAAASDPSSLQDFCVADKTSNVFENGLVCKHPDLVTSEDFYLSGLDKPGNTSNPFGAKVTLINADRIPGLNNLGISMARVDYVPGGLNTPHTHPRATEILTVIEGTLYAGFVTSNPDNKLFAKIIHKGDVFVFPRGLPGFQLNIGKTNAVSIVSLSSQNPGVNTIANAVFGSEPDIDGDVLAKAFQIDKKIVSMIQSKF